MKAPLVITRLDGTVWLPDIEVEQRKYKKAQIKARILISTLGGEGSGNFGHAGRPGEVGGSAPDGVDNGKIMLGDGAMRAVDKRQQQQEYGRLRKEWDGLNDQLFRYVDTAPDSPEAIALLTQQKEIVKQMAQLDADPGGLEGIGLPGGPRDVVIIGAGPGGMTTAIASGTEHLDTLLLDANTTPGGQPKASSRIENYPGFPIGVSGNKLAKDMYSQAERVGAETRLGTSVTGIAYNPDTGMKTLLLSNGEMIETRTVVLAGGIEFRKGDFVGSDSPKVVNGDAHKLTEMGKNGTVAVLGGSNGAAQAALGAAREADKVFVVSRSPITKSMSGYQVTALNNHSKIEVIDSDSVASFSHSRLILKSGVEIPADAVGVFLGGLPQTKWLPATIETSRGKVTTKHNLETSMPGVFAVGDIRDGSIGRISTAVGDGHVATHGIFQYFSTLQQSAEQAKVTRPVFIPPPQPKAHQPHYAGLAAREKKTVNWDAMIEKLFTLDLQHPYLSQTVEPESDLQTLGGPGSGNFGHEGRPGEVGGSGPGGAHTADSVAAEHGINKDDAGALAAKIRREATTEAERQYADEMAVAELIAKRDLTGGDTKSLHSNADGSYAEERLALHDKIYEQFFEDHLKKYGSLPRADNDQPVVTFMAGMPGAGKSTAAQDLQGNPDLVTIDPDTMKRYLPEYKEGLGSTVVQRESGDLADKLMTMAYQRRMHILIDGTMKTSGATLPATVGDGALGKMAAFKEAGYRVEARFVDVSVNESIQNSVTRFHEEFTKSGHGRYVPPSFTRELSDELHGTKPRVSFELAKNTSYKNQPLIDAYSHTRGWTGDKAKSNYVIDKRGTLTVGGTK